MVWGRGGMRGWDGVRGRGGVRLKGRVRASCNNYMSGQCDSVA